MFKMYIDGSVSVHTQTDLETSRLMHFVRMGLSIRCGFDATPLIESNVVSMSISESEPDDKNVVWFRTGNDLRIHNRLYMYLFLHSIRDRIIRASEAGYTIMIKWRDIDSYSDMEIPLTVIPASSKDIMRFECAIPVNSRPSVPRTVRWSVSDLKALLMEALTKERVVATLNEENA